MKSTLKQNRRSACRGLGRGYLHAVIGGCPYQESTLGRNICYDDTLFDDFMNHSLAAHFSIPDPAPGGHGSNARLDSCGVLVYAPFLEELVPRWGLCQKAAIVLAHEIGHAIGLGGIDKPNPRNLMYHPLDYTKYTYEDYAKFVYNPKDYARINLRRLLGREKLQVYWIIYPQN